MIVKQGKHFTTAKIFKKVCKTLFETVTILSPNFLLVGGSAKAGAIEMSHVALIETLMKALQGVGHATAPQLACRISSAVPSHPPTRQLMSG